MQVTRAICANGSITEAMGLGIEIADTAGRITGIPVMFVTPIVGDYGAVGWISTAEDLAEVEAANAALVERRRLSQTRGSAGHVFTPGASSVMMRRIG